MPVGLSSWCAAWSDVACAKLLWDLEIPSYDAVSGGWKAGRVLGGYGARWPDGYIIDLSDSFIRDPFVPADVATSSSLARVRATTQRSIRQPDGMMLMVTINAAVKGGMYAGHQPTLAERPDPLVEASPPVVAWWLGSRLNDASAIGILRSDSELIEFEALELKAVIEIRKDANSDSWYLAKLSRMGSNSKPWWSAEFQQPRSFGSPRHVLGTIRIVDIETSDRTVGSTTLPASPRIRKDFLLEAIIERSCPEKDFTQDLSGLTLSSISASKHPVQERESNKRMQEALANQAAAASAPDRARNQGSLLVWWVTGAGGILCVAIGGILIVKRRSGTV
ncbi:MAG: hypothetical protein J0L78_07045 [Planctomycetes bacterium]|nr:hypothetical protein [Planctomycetota bacterium]